MFHGGWQTLAHTNSDFLPKIGTYRWYKIHVCCVTHCIGCKTFMFSTTSISGHTFFQRCRHLRDTQNAWRHAKCVETRDGIPKFSRKTSSEPKIHVCCVTLALVAGLFCSAPRLSPAIGTQNACRRDPEIIMHDKF